MATYGIPELDADSYFICKLRQLDILLKPRIEISGYIVEMMKLKNNSALFLLEDTTGTQLCDLWLDRCDFGAENLQVGDVIRVKGQYCLDNHNQRVLKIDNLCLAKNPNEEYLYYLMTLRDMLAREKDVKIGKNFTQIVSEGEKSKSADIVNEPKSVNKQIVIQFIMEKLYKAIKTNPGDDKISFKTLEEIPQLRPFKMQKGADEFAKLLEGAILHLRMKGILFNLDNEMEYGIDVSSFSNLTQKVYKKMKDRASKTKFSFEEIRKILNNLMDIDGEELFSERIVRDLVTRLMQMQLLSSLNQSKTLFNVS